MKTIYILLFVTIFYVDPNYSQIWEKLIRNRLDKGQITYSEKFKDSEELGKRYNYFDKKTKEIVLKNVSSNSVLKIKPAIEKDTTSNILFVRFNDNRLIDMEGDDFSLSIDDEQIISTDVDSTEFIIDLKPAFDVDKPQKVDFSWNDFFDNKGFSLSAKGELSTEPDTAALNSIRFDAIYKYIVSDLSRFRYLDLIVQISSEHPQDFSQTNLVGQLAIRTTIPWTNVIARLIAGDKKSSSKGIIVKPTIEFVKNTAKKDSSYIRGAVHGNWDIPLKKNQYIKLYGIAYFQDGYRPRSYIEATFEQDISPSVAVIGKWVNGELPPLFKRESDFRIGLRFK